MTGEIIKSFLVGLGFEVDDASLAKFNKSIASAGLRVAALYGAIKLTTAAIVYGISKISEGFEQIGYEYRIIAPAINKALVMRRELLKAYAAAGINITKVIQASVKLNMSLFKTKTAFEAIYRSVASRFFGLITQQSDRLRKQLYDNMPKIQNGIERFVKFIFRLFEATNQLGSRLWSILERIYGAFVELDHATNGWSTKILAVVAAWQLLNLEFLATPLGMIITGLVAILALFDDFKVWQEGGKSLFNWSSFVPVINAVAGALSSLWDVLQDVADVIGNIVVGFYQLYKGDKDGAFDSMIEGTRAFLKVWQDVWNVVKGVGGSIGALGTWGAHLFSGGPTPLGVGGANNAPSNQSVQQQTAITVQGSADANATAHAVASQQSRVNFDMVRNLKGATR